jgi:hypothetical protein
LQRNIALAEQGSVAIEKCSIRGPGGWGCAEDSALHNPSYKQSGVSRPRPRNQANARGIMP